jgi:hypothetical protein
VNFGAIVWTGIFSAPIAARMNSSSTGVCGASVSSIDTSGTKPVRPLLSAMCR